MSLDLILGLLIGAAVVLAVCVKVVSWAIIAAAKLLNRWIEEAM